MFLYSVNVQSTKTKIALLTENSIPFSHLHRIVRSLYTIYAWRHACVHIYDFINKDFVWVKAKQSSVYVYERIVVMSEEMRYKFRENKRTIRNRKILNSRKSCKKIIFFFHIFDLEFVFRDFVNRNFIQLGTKYTQSATIMTTFWCNYFRNERKHSLILPKFE